MWTTVDLSRVNAYSSSGTGGVPGVRRSAILSALSWMMSLRPESSWIVAGSGRVPLRQCDSMRARVLPRACSVAEIS